LSGMARCRFCGSLGVVVEQFPHRGYGKRHCGRIRHGMGGRNG
jgi:hypothetical protein